MRARERIAAIDEARQACEAAAVEAVEAARRRLVHERELAQATESLPQAVGAEVGAELSHSRS